MQAELNRLQITNQLTQDLENTYKNDNPVLTYSKIVVDRIRRNENRKQYKSYVKEALVECPGIFWNACNYNQILKEEKEKTKPKKSTPMQILIQ